MNPALLIFTQIAIVGCGFMVYSFYALHRESRNSQRSPKVEIRPISTRPSRERVIQIYTVAEEHESPKKIRSRLGR